MVLLQFSYHVDWTFNGDSKLTVSGSTLWTDELDRSGVDSIFGNLTMVYNGTIKENYATGDLDDVISQVANNSYAIVLHETRLDTAEANISSNDTDIAQNSEAIVVLDSRVDTHDTEIATNAANVTSGDTLLKFIHGPQDYTLSTNTTLTVDLWLSNDHVFTIGSDLTIDGDKHAITFAKGDNNVLSVGSNALTLENVVLKDFSPSAISLTTGSVTFGNGTRIEMTDNNLLTSSNYTMTFDGTVEMNCFGNEFDISGMEHGMVVQPGGKLCLSNARITGLGGASGSSYTNNLKCIGPDSTLTMSNCDLVMESNYSFTEGIIDIYQDVAIRGPEKPSGTSLVFAYQSPQAATIRSLGKLMFDRYITFSYDSDSATKDKIIMEDATSILHLNGCTLYSTQTGLELTGGRLVVEDKVTVQNEATIQSEAMVLKDPLDIDVLSGGVLDLTAGLLEYQ